MGIESVLKVGTKALTQVAKKAYVKPMCEVRTLESLGLKMEKLTGDVVQLSSKPRTALSYTQKQAMDIARYGEKQVERVNVTDEMLQKFTPHRRLSNKPCTLKNPDDYEYFIKKFETEAGVEFLPQNWAELTDAQKYDYIVKDRYARLVSNKIMNSIQHETVEHYFGLTRDGEILEHVLGDSRSVHHDMLLKDSISIHNHPHNLEQCGIKGLAIKIDPREFVQRTPHSMTPQSCGDIMYGYGVGGKHYVVDSNGNKYLFESQNMVFDGICYNLLKTNLSAQQQTVLDFSSPSTNSLFKEIIQLNNELKAIDKFSDEYKTTVDKLKELLFKYHEETFNQKILCDNIKLVTKYSNVIKIDTESSGGMRLLKIN